MEKPHPVGPWTIVPYGGPIGFEFVPRAVIETLRKRFGIPLQGTGETVFRCVIECCIRRQFSTWNKRRRKKLVTSALRLYERFNTLPQYVMTTYWRCPAKFVNR